MAYRLPRDERLRLPHMVELLHRIKVFVFQQEGPEPHYLLLRPNQGLEALWGPIQGGIRYGEKLESAIRREVLDDIGVLRPLDLIDLEMPSRMILARPALGGVSLGGVLRGLSAPRDRDRPRGLPALARLAALARRRSTEPGPWFR